MLENIKEHEELVKKFIEKVKIDYEKHLDIFIGSISSATTEELEADKEYVNYDIPITSTILSWIKTNIIDYGEILFNTINHNYSETNEAIYYINKEDIEILMESDFITNIEGKILMVGDNINALSELFSITVRNFSNYFISILDRTHYDNHKEDFENE